jgi:hypothetical protein
MYNTILNWPKIATPGGTICPISYNIASLPGGPSTRRLYCLCLLDSEMFEGKEGSRLNEKEDLSLWKKILN